MATEVFMSPVSLTASVNQISHLLYLNCLQQCYQNAAIILQNLDFKQEMKKFEQGQLFARPEIWQV